MATSMLAFALLTTMTSSALADLAGFPMTAAAIMPRQDPGVSTCGYLTGNPDKAREANSGFDCRSYSTDGSGLWGFCPTGMAIASDCSFAAACYDSGSCTSGCGIMTSGLYSITWYAYHSTRHESSSQSDQKADTISVTLRRQELLLVRLIY